MLNFYLPLYKNSVPKHAKIFINIGSQTCFIKSSKRPMTESLVSKRSSPEKKTIPNSIRTPIKLFGSFEQELLETLKQDNYKTEKI